jgi:hypothetical protein
MVLSGSKMARYASSLAGLPTGGGPKKQGLPPTVGQDSTIVSYHRSLRAGYCCLAYNKTLPTGNTVSWKGTVGMRIY